MDRMASLGPQMSFLPLTGSECRVHTEATVGWGARGNSRRDHGARDHVHGCLSPSGFPGGPEPCVPGAAFTEEAGGPAGPGPVAWAPLPASHPFPARLFTASHTSEWGCLGLLVRAISRDGTAQTPSSLPDLTVLTALPNYKAKAPFGDEKSNIVAGTSRFFENQR